MKQVPYRLAEALEKCISIRLLKGISKDYCRYLQRNFVYILGNVSLTVDAFVQVA